MSGGSSRLSPSVVSGLRVQPLVVPAGVLRVVRSGHRVVSRHVSGGGVDGSAGGQRASLQPPSHHRPRTHEVRVGPTPS